MQNTGLAMHPGASPLQTQQWGAFLAPSPETQPPASVTGLASKSENPRGESCQGWQRAGPSPSPGSSHCLPASMMWHMLKMSDVLLCCPCTVVSEGPVVVPTREVCRCQPACGMCHVLPNTLSKTLVVSPKYRQSSFSLSFQLAGLGSQTPLRSLTLRELVFSGRSSLIQK